MEDGVYEWFEVVERPALARILRRQHLAAPVIFDAWPFMVPLG